MAKGCYSTMSGPYLSIGGSIRDLMLVGSYENTTLLGNLEKAAQHELSPQQLLRRIKYFVFILFEQL